MMRSLVTLPCFISVLFFVLTHGEGVDYCNRSLCKRGNIHIACGNNGEISPDCADTSEIIELPPEIREKILVLHNGYRNQIACGLVPGFLSAHRMTTMQWNDELASMADLNVKTCTATHDACRNTYNFTKSGQNIARKTTTEEILTIEQVEVIITQGIKRWFLEHETCSKFDTLYTPSKSKSGHFTVMVSERNNYLGCALILMKKVKTVFTCNYAWTNLKNRVIYTPGIIASGCQSGINADYPGLCSTDEIY